VVQIQLIIYLTVLQIKKKRGGLLLTTKIDTLFDIVQTKKRVLLLEVVKQTALPLSTTTKIFRYLEELGFVTINYQNIQGPLIKYVKSPGHEFKRLSEGEIIQKLKNFMYQNDVKSANKLLYDLYNFIKDKHDETLAHMYNNIHTYFTKNFLRTNKKEEQIITPIDKYTLKVEKLSVDVEIVKNTLEPVPYYKASLLVVSDLTQRVIQQIQKEVISNISFNMVYKTHEEETLIKSEYKKHILEVMEKIFADFSHDKINMLCDYILLTSLGMGEVEFLLKDPNLEEIVINNSEENVWVYHKKHGWLETNIIIDDEKKISHFATIAGRNVNRTITTLQPLLDAHLKTGDRVNATLDPISSKGNTITIRKFAESPWSITDLIKSDTISYEVAAMIWTAIQYELSILIVGGTGSGKTSTLNVFSIFIPPNNRIISIEDTREIKLPKTLHWVPLETRLPNPEGKGGISMLDLIVNSLRMRPDRIIVGEIRRKEEAEVLFEAMHTGHSVYATLHANTVNEAIVRLTTDPIGISPTLLSAIGLVVVQNRNRRTGNRRTFEVAEVNNDGTTNILYRYNFKSDTLAKIKAPSQFYTILELFAGLTKQEVDKEISDKIKVLKYLTKNNIRDNEEIAGIINFYYVNKKYMIDDLFKGKNIIPGGKNK